MSTVHTASGGVTVAPVDEQSEIDTELAELLEASREYEDYAVLASYTTTAAPVIHHADGANWSHPTGFVFHHRP